MAAGHCRLQYHETIYELDEPTIILAERNPALSAAQHQILDETPAPYLRLRILDRAPGVHRALARVHDAPVAGGGPGDRAGASTREAAPVG